MRVSRREFLRAAAGMAGVLGLNASGLLKLQDALAATAGLPVIWLQGSGCTGCSVSLLNSIYYTTVDDLLLNKLDLEYHPNVMAAAGGSALSAAATARPTFPQLNNLNEEWLIDSPGLSNDLDGNGVVNFLDYARLAKRGFALIVEGAIPTGANGAYCEIGENLTMVDAMRKYATAANAIIAVGSCAAFGGIPAATPNPTGAMSVKNALSYLGIQKPVINIPGCPMHPDWLVGTVIDILGGQNVNLDSNGRPTKYFGTLVHDNCPNLSSFNTNYSGQLSHAGNQACLACHANTDTHVPNPRSLGTAGCLFALGCKGRLSHGDCPTRKWNNPAQNTAGVNWCVGAGSPCIGCTEPNFPDGMDPFYQLGGSGIIDD